MPMDAGAIFTRIREVIMNKVSMDADRRSEALYEYFGVSLPGMDREAARILADNAPPLLPALYEKWTFMFFKRLMETVPSEQLELLCDGQEESDGAIALAYLMFMESERMEKQVAEDLKECGLSRDADPQSAAVMGEFIRMEISKAREEKQNERLGKAAAYQNSQGKRTVH